MANTSILGLALPFALLRCLSGAPVTFALISTIAPAATAVSWFYMLVRCEVVRSRTAAYLGALFCASAPRWCRRRPGTRTSPDSS